MVSAWLDEPQLGAQSRGWVFQGSNGRAYQVFVARLWTPGSFVELRRLSADGKQPEELLSGSLDLQGARPGAEPQNEERVLDEALVVHVTPESNPNFRRL